MTRMDSGGKMPDDGLSLDHIIRLRAEAHAAIRMHAGRIASIADAVSTMDERLTITVAVRGMDAQQAVINAARVMSALLAGGSAVAR